MKDFEHLNPLCVFFFFFSVVFVTAFFPHPIFTAVSLLGAVFMQFFCGKSGGLRSYLPYIFVFIITALLNPLISHNGKTVLFVLNDNPITLEALLFGINSAGMILSVILWFRCFSKVMTSDKLLYLFSVLSPKAALVLSIALRYVPLFFKKRREISDSAKGMGIFKADNAPDRLKGHMGVFSALVTWGLEKGIITADSMEARGYGTGRRSRFSIFAFKLKDGLFLGISGLLFLFVLLGQIFGGMNYSFYPSVSISLDPPTLIFSAVFSVLCFLPCFINAKEELRWRSLRQKI